jgi:seryl-tRNA synthetase
MHDIRVTRENPDAFAAGLGRRGLDGAGLAQNLLAKDKALRELLTRLQTQQARRNEASKLIGQAKQKKDEAQAKALMDEVSGLKDAIQQGEAEQRKLEVSLRDALAVIPNIPAADVPDGADESANVPVAARAFGKPPSIDNPKQHFEIGEALGQMDFERAAKVSGARFVYLKSDLARLERALGAFMLDTHTQTFGYTEVSPPVLVHSTAMFGTGQLPKFQDDLFRVPAGEGDPFWLIPTAEVPLTNYVADEILNEAELPLRMTAFTPCFRAEAGAAGRDTRGMIRMHQFSKVELVSITTPEQSASEHERMTDAAQEILKKLDLAHRVVTLCTGDMGFSAQKTYDIEVWLPGQSAYREGEGKVKGPVHTLNGSGLAVGRTLVAILENYQQPDGSVAIPSALQSYMGGKTSIAKL